jgi:hypothetical protein
MLLKTPSETPSQLSGMGILGLPSRRWVCWTDLALATTQVIASSESLGAMSQLSQFPYQLCLRPGFMASKDIESLSSNLNALSDRELSEVLRQVLEHRRQREAGYETRLFVGYATFESFTETWEIGGIAYRDREHYGESFGPDSAISFHGECETCRFSLYSHVNYGQCPLCDSRVRLS